MLREIYFRDPTDPRFIENVLEVSDSLEALISKLRMILLTNKGEVLGEPFLGMDLEKYIMEQNINTGTIRAEFYAQMGKYIPESSKYQIDCDIKTSTDGVSNKIYLDVSINNIPYLGYEL